MSEYATILLLAAAGIVVAGTMILCRMAPRLGLPLSPFLSAAVTFCIRGGGEYDYLTVVAALAGLLNLLLALLFVVTSRQSPDGPNLAQSVAKVFLLLLAVIVGLALTIGLAGPVGFLFTLALFAAIIRYILLARETWTTHLFTTIGAALRQNLSLPTALEAEAEALRGKPRVIFRGISRCLSAGLPLSEAIRRGFPQCPGYATSQIAAGEKIGQLPPALALIERQLAQRGREAHKLQVVNPMYPFLVVFVACMILIGVAVFILPKFQVIFMDRGSSLPRLTQWVFSTVVFMREYGLIVALIVAAMLAVVVLWFYTLFRPRDPRNPKLLSRLGDVVKWHLPASRWFEKNYALLQTVAFLRLAMHAGVRVDRAIAEAAELDLNLCYRRKLDDWLDRVRRGEDIASAARDSGVGKSLQWAFDQQANPGQTPAVLEMLESSYRSAYSYKANLARYIFWPGVTLSLALLVGCIVLALFLPMVGLLRAATGEVLP